MLNEHFEAEKNGDENSTMLHYVRLGSNLKSLQFDEDTGPVPKILPLQIFVKVPMDATGGFIF